MCVCICVCIFKCLGFDIYCLLLFYFLRIIAGHISDLAQKSQPTKRTKLLYGFLFRTLINAILRPDLYGIVEEPYIPFPKVNKHRKNDRRKKTNKQIHKHANKQTNKQIYIKQD
jgi:hypothetical protein